MKTLSHLLLILLLPVCALAQDYKRTYNWYFGNKAGLNFETDTPSILTDGNIHSWEGCASISDTDGVFLMYTDGDSVRNSTHQLIQNGFGLYGDNSSTQSSLIVPLPDNDSIFYVFTTYAVAAPAGFNYSIVNLKGANGIGTTVKKNVFVQPSVCEKLTAVHHQNGKDIWILVHGFYSNVFYAYLLTKDGLKECPVTSSVGINHTGDGANAQGAMKFSQSGKKLAVAIYVSQIVQVFDFDIATGKISNPITLNNIFLPYGVEFSPNEKLLYITDKGKNLYQYNLSTGNSSTINNSQYIISNQARETFQSIQIAANGKMYIANYDSSFLSVINYPDSFGSQCGFNFRGQLLGGSKKSQAGLPNFVTSYFYKDTALNFNYEFICPGNQVVLKGRNNKTNANWQISKAGESNSITNNNLMFNHTFNDTGIYHVTLRSGSDSITKIITVGAYGDLLTPSDTVACQKDSILLAAASGFECYRWNDTVSASLIYAKKNGTYRVTAWNAQGCKLNDSIHVTLHTTPPTALQKPLPDSISFCLGSTIILDADSGKNFTWQDGVHTAKRSVDTSGTFFTYFIDSNNCQRADTVKLKTYSIVKPLVQLFSDSFWTSDTYTQWQWFRNGQPVNNATQNFHKALQNGYYQVSITDTGNCKALSDSVLINNVGTIDIENESIKIYPNPAKSAFTIEVQSGEYAYSLTGISGLQLLSGKLVQGGNVINSSSLLPGIYFIKIINQNTTYVKKLIIQ